LPGICVYWIIGAAIGLNAAFLNITTEWLSDVKLGYCETAFYLNEQFCCWGEDNGMHGRLMVDSIADNKQVVRTGTAGLLWLLSTTSSTLLPLYGLFYLSL
jgi:chloride channel 3/4/5